MTDEPRRPRIISADSVLKIIEEEKNVQLRNAVIVGDLDLNKLDLPTQQVERIKLPKHMGGSAEDVTIVQDVKIVRSSIDITNSTILGTLDFSNAIFSEEAKFDGTTFSEEARFGGATFSRDARFNRATFTKNARFIGATFTGNAEFDDATFSGDARFDGATFSSDARFGRATFSRDAGFIITTFTGNAWFIGAIFRTDVRFLDTLFYQRLNFDETKYEHAYIRWDMVKDHLEYQGATYLTLIKNFKNLEFFEDADACYYQYRRIAQSKKSWYGWSKLLDIFAWVTCGYGVKVWRPVFCVLGCVFVFALLYGLFNGIANVGPSEISSISLSIGPIVIQNTHPTEVYAGVTSWADYLYFSAATLTSNTSSELRPLGAWKYVVMIEHLMGYMFLALFVVVLTKKMIR